MDNVPVHINIKALRGVILGVVADPNLLEQYPTDVASTVARKVLQASSYAQSLGTRAFFVVQNETSEPVIRYLDAVGATVVYSKALPGVNLIVPESELFSVDAILQFFSPKLDFDYEAPDGITVTQVPIKLSPKQLNAFKDIPHTEKPKKYKTVPDPYAHFRIPKDLLVQKIPDTYRETMLNQIPEFPENYTLDGSTK